MRKNLKKKIRGMVDKFGPELFEDFDNNRIIKRKGSNTSDNNLLSVADNRSLNRNSGGSVVSRGSFTTAG
jgi:hypothetical protein